MIGRPKVQLSGGCFCLVVDAGPPDHSQRQPLMHVVVWPVGSSWKASSRSASGSRASTM
jgi:hypothetical protein